MTDLMIDGLRVKIGKEEKFFSDVDEARAWIKEEVEYYLKWIDAKRNRGKVLEVSAIPAWVRAPSPFTQRERELMSA